METDRDTLGSTEREQHSRSSVHPDLPPEEGQNATHVMLRAGGLEVKATVMFLISTKKISKVKITECLH
ncbi:hypothetical protein AOLI_G00083160 [Acnodon oligacanthus]